jgi:hypothetical protein
MSHYNKLILAAILPVFFAAPAVLAADKLTAEDVLKRHLDSIGNAAARVATKSRVVEGATKFKVVSGGAGWLDGETVVVSEGRKLQLMMKFPKTNFYHGETFICDGNKVQVAFSTDAHTRSNFGQFVYLQDVVLREGLLGGELSTAWPLLDLDQRKPKLRYEGLKTIDGKQVHDIQYRPYKNQNVEVHLYFDPETFHHVMTVYTLSISPRLVRERGGNESGLPPAPVQETEAQQAIPGTSSNETAQARQQETRYRVEERFSDFKTADSLTLPNHYNIHFMEERQTGKTAILEWDTSVTRILENVPLDPRNFQVK